jgi:hypothetical protein
MKNSPYEHNPNQEKETVPYPDQTVCAANFHRGDLADYLYFPQTKQFQLLV